MEALSRARYHKVPRSFMRGDNEGADEHDVLGIRFEGLENMSYMVCKVADDDVIEPLVLADIVMI